MYDARGCLGVHTNNRIYGDGRATSGVDSKTRGIFLRIASLRIKATRWPAAQCKEPLSLAWSHVRTSSSSETASGRRISWWRRSLSKRHVFPTYPSSFFFRGTVRKEENKAMMNPSLPCQSRLCLISLLLARSSGRWRSVALGNGKR